MLTIKGKIAKLKVKEQVVGVLFDYQMAFDSEGASLKSKHYWIDSDSPRVRFVEACLVFDTQILKAQLDLGTARFCFDSLVSELVSFQCKNVNLKKRSSHERVPNR